MRYFIRPRDNPAAPDYGRALAVFRFDPAQGIAEKWNVDKGEWEFNANVIEATGIGGTTDFQEVSEEEATRLTEPVSGERGEPLLTPALRRLVDRGGPGSGFRGHAGRPGEVGGSAPGEGGAKEAPPKAAGPSDAAAFYAAIESAFSGSPFTNHVNHYSIEELAGMKAVLLSGDGKVGVAVKDHGDGRIEATALFNQGGRPGDGIRLLREVVEEYGVNYVEAFGPVLPMLYAEAGFQVTEQYPFSPTLAPPTWDYDRFGQPDYFIMRRRNE